jgi:fructuronate reductase
MGKYFLTIFLTLFLFTHLKVSDPSLELELNYEGLQNKKGWEKAGVLLPNYDVKKLAEKTKKNPMWVHFGIGNIFRFFIGGIADKLISENILDKGITCVEAFDYDVVDKIYKPYDNLALGVTLHKDGKQDKRIIGSLTEAIKAPEEIERLKEIFKNPELQLISFTITEKGYALHDSKGNYFGFVKSDIENGPEKATSAMGIVAAMLFERFKAGKYPLAVVSMDNMSQNGKKLRDSIFEMSHQWLQKNYVNKDFIDYIQDEKIVSFPWSMIDKITPRPSESVAKSLEQLGIKNMEIIITNKKTYIAPFINAEDPQYLVIEDNFPNGRPKFEKVPGVYMSDRNTVNLSERMKVTTCLNPLHTAMCTYDCMLGYKLIADGMKDEEIKKLIHQLGYIEGLPVVESPGIISPKEFLDEVINIRFPNPYLGDQSARIACDTSQKVGIRFGETIKSHLNHYKNTDKLIAIPLAIAGWMRYLIGKDDQGKDFELSPDPMLSELKEKLAGIELGKPESVGDKLKPILKNRNIFGIDLYQAGLGEKIENILKEELAGVGAVRKTLKKYLSNI